MFERLKVADKLTQTIDETCEKKEKNKFLYYNFRGILISGSAFSEV